MKVAGVGAVVFGDGTILLSNSSDSVVSSVTRTGPEEKCACTSL